MIILHRLENIGFIFLTIKMDSEKNICICISVYMDSACMCEEHVGKQGEELSSFPN